MNTYYPKEPVIYKITSPSAKVYIGQAWNVRRRLYVYESNNCKNQTKLHNSILKYGWNSHQFEIVHQLPSDVSQEILTSYEQLYMDLYRGAGIVLMNLKEAGSVGRLSEETKEKMREKRKGRKHSPETIEKMKGKFFSEERRAGMRLLQKNRYVPVLQFSKSGEFLKEFESLTSAANAVGSKATDILKVCKGVKYKPTAKGFRWKFKNIK